MAVRTRNHSRNGSSGSGREVVKVTSRIIRRTLAEHVSLPTPDIGTLLSRAREGSPPLAERVRRLPIQCSVDIAVPLELAYAEWLRLEFLPEGAHRVTEIERQGDGLHGRVSGLGPGHEWRAEITEERPNESFAWRSKTGSDCAGLVTFHELSDRLTRLELQLDVVAVGVEEAVELMLHTADRRAQADLRRFKARLETISPDEYPPAEDADRDGIPDQEEE